mmetsp:Transcript_71973/g.165101  ORF Transcript_71973/g.165101 Transcript_71973/m.165101 type:complete len:678 (-) Transcript_71973:272-2305(-)
MRGNADAWRANGSRWMAAGSACLALLDMFGQNRWGSVSLVKQALQTMGPVVPSASAVQWGSSATLAQPRLASSVLRTRLRRTARLQPATFACVAPAFFAVAGDCTQCPDQALEDRLCRSQDGFAEDCCVTLDRDVPRQPPGYYLKQRGRDWDMYRCISEDFCPQSEDPTTTRCSPNFDPESLVCARCMEGYHLVKNKCEACEEGVSALPFVFAVLLCVTLLLFVYYKLNSPVSEEASPLLETCVTLAMTLTATQSLSVMAQLNIVWESPGSDVMEAMKIFAFDIELLNFECFWSSDPETRYYFRLMIPIMAIIGFFSCFGLSRLLHRSVGNKVSPWQLSKTCNSCGQIFQALYIGIALAAMLPFQCYEHPTGASSMRKFPEVICGESIHDAMFAVAVMATMIYGAGFYGICIFVAVRAPVSSMRNVKFNQYFRFLLANFRSDTWWWGVMLLTRSFLIALVPIIFPTNGNAQLVMLSTIVSVFLTLQSYYKPWKSMVLNLADTCVCLMLLLLSAVSGVFADAEKLEKSPFTVFMFVILVVSGLTMSVVFCRALLGMALGRPLSVPFLPASPVAEDLCFSLTNLSKQLAPLDTREVLKALQNFGQFDRLLVQNYVTLMSVALDRDDLRLSGSKTPSFKRLSTAQLQSAAKSLKDSSSRLKVSVPEVTSGVAAMPDTVEL